VDDERTAQLRNLTEKRGRSFFRGEYSIPASDLLDQRDVPKQCPLDAPHVVKDVDSPASYCRSCGSPMQIRMARFSGYDDQSGIPCYALVRACPKASFNEAFGLVCRTDIGRHTVQGPTDTKKVLITVPIVLLALLVFC